MAFKQRCVKDGAKGRLTLPLAALLLLGVLIAGALSASCGGGKEADPMKLVPGGFTLAPPPPGPGEPVPIMPTRLHVPEGQPVKYNSTPPTSGDHWQRWADCGFYAKGLPDELIIHNLEHGNIVVSYNLESGEEVVRLREAVHDIDLSGLWGVIRFYDKIPAGAVAVAAWGVMDSMKGVDGDRIALFFTAYSGNLGPERIPC